MARGRNIYYIRTETIVGSRKRKGSSEILPVAGKNGKWERNISRGRKR